MGKLPKCESVFIMSTYRDAYLLYHSPGSLSEALLPTYFFTLLTDRKGWHDTNYGVVFTVMPS